MKERLAVVISRQHFSKFREWIHKNSKVSAMDIFAGAGITGLIFALTEKSWKKNQDNKEITGWPGLKEWKQLTPEDQNKYRECINGEPTYEDPLLADGSTRWERDFRKGMIDFLSIFAAYALGVVILKWLFPLKQEEHNEDLAKPSQLLENTQKKENQMQDTLIEYRNDWREKTISEQKQKVSNSLAQG